MTTHRFQIILCLLLGLVGCGQSVAQATTEVEVSSTPPVKTARQMAREKTETLSMQECIEQMMVVSMRTYNDENFIEMNPEMETFLTSHNLGGVILFRENCADNAQIATLNQAIRHSNQTIPLFLGVDQEGGIVTRIPYACDMPGNMALCATGIASNAFQSGQLIGQELGALGFTMNFAPDVDINNNPSNPIIGIRSFSDEAEGVSVFGHALCKGLEEAGIIPVIKHFPGHGNTDVDSHTGLPCILSDYASLQSQELIPFQSLIDGGVDAIMSAHIQFPMLEETTYTSKLDGNEIYLPATLSKAIMNDVLRGDMGYQGIIITDSFQMDAIKSHFDLLDASILAIEASVDMILMPIDINSQEAMQEFDAYIEKLVEACEADEHLASLVKDAVTRIIEVKLKHNVNATYTVDQTQLAQVGSEEHHAIETSIAIQAVTLLKNEGVLPVSKEGPMVLLAAPYESQMNGMIYGYRQYFNNANYVAVNYEYGNATDALYAGIDTCDVIIIASDFRNMSNIERTSSPRLNATLETIERAHAQGKKVVVISIGVPYDVALFQEADVLMAVYGDNGLSFLEDGSVAKAYGPNIPAAFAILSGDVQPQGRLPIAIPIIEGDTINPKENLYERGYGIQLDGEALR